MPFIRAHHIGCGNLPSAQTARCSWCVGAVTVSLRVGCTAAWHVRGREPHAAMARRARGRRPARRAPRASHAPSETTPVAGNKMAMVKNRNFITHLMFNRCVLADFDVKTQLRYIIYWMVRLFWYVDTVLIKKRCL